MAQTLSISNFLIERRKYGDFSNHVLELYVYWKSFFNSIIDILKNQESKSGNNLFASSALNNQLFSALNVPKYNYSDYWNFPRRNESLRHGVERLRITTIKKIKLMKVKSGYALITGFQLLPVLWSTLKKYFIDGNDIEMSIAFSGISFFLQSCKSSMNTFQSFHFFIENLAYSFLYPFKKFMLAFLFFQVLIMCESCHYVLLRDVRTSSSRFFINVETQMQLRAFSCVVSNLSGISYYSMMLVITGLNGRLSRLVDWPGKRFEQHIEKQS